MAEIIVVNNVDSKIIKIAKELNDRYFKDVGVSIGLYQSENYESIHFDGDRPSFVVSEMDASFLSAKFSELKEIADRFIGDIEVIIWFGKSVCTKEIDKIKHIVAHELKHVEQQVAEPVSYNKNQVLDCVFSASSREGTPENIPVEKDADNFANIVVDESGDDSYSWAEETDRLFDEKEEMIKQLYKRIKKNTDEIIINDTVFITNKEERALFCHFFEKIYRT